MTTIQIDDPWLESIYNHEFKSNSTLFLETFKTFLTENYQKKKIIKALFKQYEDGEISIGKIAEKLHIDREEVWELMEKYNVYWVDYDLSADDKTIVKYLRK